MNTVMLQDRNKTDVYLTSRLRSLLERYCSENKMSMSSVMRILLIRFLKAEGYLSD